MKYFIVLIISFSLLSCKKDNQGNDLSNDAYIKYKVNGTQQQFSGNAANVDAEGVIAYKVINLYTSYHLQGEKGLNNLISLSIVADSLKNGSYKGEPIATFISYNGKEYYILNDTQILNVSITRHSSGTVDGNFSGSLYDTQGSVSITEGEFKNIKMIY